MKTRTKSVRRKVTKVTKPEINEDTIRRKAKEIYLHTGNQNADENWFQAKAELGLQ